MINKIFSSLLLLLESAKQYYTYKNNIFRFEQLQEIERLDKKANKLLSSANESTYLAGVQLRKQIHQRRKLLGTLQSVNDYSEEEP